MKLFRRTRDLVPHDPATEITRLREEAAAVDQAVQAMRDAHHRELERMKARITEERAAKAEALQREAALETDLGTARDNERALRRQLADALAENKKLDGENIVLAGEVLELNGRLHDAEEQLAGYRRERVA